MELMMTVSMSMEFAGNSDVKGMMIVAVVTETEAPITSDMDKKNNGGLLKTKSTFNDPHIIPVTSMPR